MEPRKGMSSEDLEMSERFATDPDAPAATNRITAEDVFAIMAERDRLALDAGISTILLEGIADGLVAPTRDAIAARRAELYAIARKKQ